MRNMLKMKTLSNATRAGVRGLIIVSLQFTAPQVFAQEDLTIEEVVVTGIRKSITDAIAVKRNASAIVDAISAEDIGKLPDENVAETLQRVNGVQIQRRNGEGARVSVRGLVQNRLEVDGSTLVSPLGRSYSGFDESVFPVLQFIPSELLSGAQIHKSASSNQVEGALGGVVNLTLHNPLDLGNKVSVGIQGSYDDISEDTDPRFSGLISRTFADDTLGVVLSYTEAKRSLGEELFFSRTGWSTGDSGFASPGDFRLQNLEEDRDKTGLLAKAQWKPNEYSEIYARAFSATFDIERNRSWFSSSGSGGADPAGYLDAPVISSNNTILAGTYISQIQGNGEHNEIDSETDSFALGGNFTIGNWDLRAEITDGSASQNEQQDFVRVRQNDVAFFRDYRSSTPILNVVDGFDILNPAGYSSGSGLIGFSNDVLYENEETTFTFDANYTVGEGFVRSVDAGIRRADQEATRNWMRAANTVGLGVWTLDTTDGLVGKIAPELYEVVNLDVHGGGNSNVGSYIAGNPDGLGSTEALNQFVQANGDPGEGVFRPTLGNTFGTKEDIESAYLKINFGGEIAGTPYEGNIGVRKTKTDQESSYFLVTDSGATPASVNRSYDDVLPSLNLRFDLRDDLTLRFAAAEVLARPDTTQLRGSVSVDALAGTAAGGNPELAPATATALDLSLEWYITDTSVLSGALFSKDVDGFLSTQTIIESLPGFVNNNVASPDFGTDRFLTTRVVASGESSIEGLELAFSHIWDSGFGTQLNYTLVDSDGVNVASGASTALEGLSENSFNVVAFYEQERYSIRFAYNWRDEFLVSRNFNGSPLSEKDRGQLDFNASYNVTDNITLTLEAINLNDEMVEQFSDLEERKFRIEDTGRRLLVGVRGNF